MIKSFKQYFEQDVWRSRLPVLVAVITSLLITSGVVYILSVDVRYLLGHLRQLADPGLTTEMRTRLDVEIVAEAIKVLLDVYLFAISLLIFALGLYELLASKGKIGLAQGLEFAARLFLTHGVGGLKNWLIGVVLLRLVIRFFQQTLRLEHEGTLDLVYLAVVILLIGSALYLGRRRGEARH